MPGFGPEGPSGVAIVDSATPANKLVVSAFGELATLISSPRGVGTATNLWNAVAVGAGGNSASVASYLMRNFIIYGNASAATTITVQVSGDQVTWRTSPVNVVLSAAGDFVLDCRALTGAWYLRLVSSAAATITAGAQGNY